MVDIIVSVRPEVLARLLAIGTPAGKDIGELIAAQLTTAAKASPGRHRSTSNPLKYELLGEERGAWSAIDVLVDVLRTLAELDAALLPQLAIKARGRSRNHIARAPRLVYPSRPDLAAGARVIVPGWFVGTNISNRDKSRILKAACDVAGLTWGVDLKPPEELR